MHTPEYGTGTGKVRGTGTGTEDGKYFKKKYGYGDGYGRILDPEVRKEYGLKLLLKFKYGTETGTEKFLNLKYGYGFRTRLRTPGYGINTFFLLEYCGHSTIKSLQKHLF